MKSADQLHLMMFYLRFVSISALLGLGVFVAVRVVNLEPDTQCQTLLLQCQQAHALAPVSVRGIPTGPTSSANPDSPVKDPL